jgi:cytochrome b6
VTSSNGSRVGRWLDERVPVTALRDFFGRKSVPTHRYFVFYYLGGMTLFFFGVQVLTGILLMLYYRPSAQEAFESIEFLMAVVPFGWLIRSIHAWSANLMVLFGVLHLATVFFVKAYRRPRELIWITGCILFFLILAFGFSGYLLPWNELAFFATKVGTKIASVVPVIGDWLEQFLRGGERVSGATLSRFYGWHVAILPALATLVLVVHLLLVQIQGMSAPPGSTGEAERRRPMRFFPDFALRDLFGWIVALAVLVAMAALFPWELGEKADPFAPAPANIRPEWYFIFLFETLKLVPGGSVAGLEYEAIPILLSLVGAVGLVLVPFFDNDPLRKGRSRLLSGLGAVALLYAVGMTAWGYRSLVPLVIAVGLIGLLAVLTRAAGDRRAS